jgi:glycosyltransferase involved in cell wall biosynthesis
MSARLRVGFAVEQALGHVAHGMSLRRALAPREDLECVWIEVPFGPGGLGARPGVRSNGTLRGSLRARELSAAEHRRQPLDVLFIHTQTISLFAGGLMSQIPTLLSLDATPLNLDALAAHYAHHVRPGPVESLKKALHSRVMRRARAFTTWSEWAKRSLVDHYGVTANNVTVVHPGTTLSNYEGRGWPAGMQEGPLRVLFVGGDFQRKGGDVLLAAFEQRLRNACELHIVTTANVRAGHGMHVYNGLAPHSPELLRLFREADVFVLPTRGDCLAVVLGEAMAASLPVITTDVGAHAEAVGDGDNGFIIDVDDVTALSDRLLRLAADRTLVQRMGIRSRAIAEERFDIAKGAETLAGILTRIASTGEAGRSTHAA